MRWPFIFLLATNLLVSTAQSIIQSATDTDGDAVLTLTLEDVITVSPPSVNWRTVSIEVDGNNVSFTAGDMIELWVYEDDVVGDDLLYDINFVVTPAEVSAQQVIRVFDCSSDPANLLGELGDTAEIYAEAVVTKDACSAFCFYDRPETIPLDVFIDDSMTAAPSSHRVNLLGDAYPNPFNPRTTISYALRERSATTLEIYDLGGSRIQTLVDAILPAGEHLVSWNGRDANGRSVASGVYLYQLRAGDLVETKRMVLLK